MISIFIKRKIKGRMWVNKDKKIFMFVCWEKNISFTLWDKFKNIIIENEVTEIEIIKIRIIVNEFHKIILDIMKISLIVLIVGGADTLIAININHQNVRFGEIDVRPLKQEIFRVWYFM